MCIAKVLANLCFNEVKDMVEKTEGKFVYIVFGTTLDFVGGEVWWVKAFLNEENAQSFCDKLNEKLLKGEQPDDPEFRLALYKSFDIEYMVGSIPLEE